MRALAISFLMSAALHAGDWSALINAAQSGNTAALQASLKQRTNVNLTGPDGATALLWAAHRNDLAQVNLLLRAGAKAQIANEYGVTPLMEAARNGSAPILEKLLAAGADPNSATPEGETVLMSAARSGNLDAVRALITRGAKIDSREKWKGQTALMWAAAGNHAGIAKLLIERGADVNAQSTLWPVEVNPYPANGNLVSVRPRGGLTPLLYAAREGALDAARVLIEGGANVNLAEPDGTSSLVIAILNAHYDLAALLLDAHADPNIADKSGRAALYAAVDLNTMEPSVTRPAPKETDHHSAFDIIRMALANGANPNAQLTGPIAGRALSDYPDPILRAGTTPFIRAAKTGDTATMRLLLENGADPQLTTKDKTTALMAAAGLGWKWGESLIPEPPALEAVRLCLQTGLDVNAANEQGETALHGAAARGGLAIIPFLVDHGARMDVKDKLGRTPLAVATGDSDRGHPGYPEAAKLLAQLMHMPLASAR